MNGKYLAWPIENGEASRMLSEERLVIKLTLSVDGIFAEGFWPEKFEIVRNVISGVCLWDWRWQVQFQGTGKQAGAKRTLSSLYERKEIWEKLSEGKKVVKITYPLDLGDYHRLFIPWLAKKISHYQPENLFFHIPEFEYLSYISRLEKEIGADLGEVKADLSVYAGLVKNELLSELEALKVSRTKLTCLNPMSAGAEDEEKSFLYPYLYPEKFGIEREGLVGIEDLAEVALAWQVLQQTGKTIPVLAGVLALPAPYFNKQGRVGQNKTISLV